MNPEIKAIILSALDLKEQSLKRASKSANARFKVLYDLEIEQVADARKYITSVKG